MTPRGPAPDELEVSVLGPGVGESIVVHLGQGRWAIVDSCRSRSNDVAPLTYLRSLGLDPARCVDWVIATHAHDDHIAGFADVVRECVGAKVALPNASTVEEFMALTNLDARLEFYRTRWRVYGEYERAMSELELSGGLNRLEFFGAGQTLPLSAAISTNEPVVLHFLAPSSAAVRRCQQVFARLIEAARQGRAADRVLPRDPNSFSGAILIRCLGCEVLLGGDLRNGNETWGWVHVVAEFEPTGHVEMFKVAHHGDPRAHHDVLWSSWLTTTAAAVTTPYRPSGRPRESDVARMCGTGARVWLTAKPGEISLSNEVRRTGAALRRVSRDVAEDGGLMGHVRYRRRAGMTAEIDAFGPAQQVC